MVKRFFISEYTCIYPMGDTIKNWPRDLEAELREQSEILFCGVALALVKHYNGCLEEPDLQFIGNPTRWEYLHALKEIGNPKYIIIADFLKPGPVNSPLLSDEITIRNFGEWL